MTRRNGGTQKSDIHDSVIDNENDPTDTFYHVKTFPQVQVNQRNNDRQITAATSIAKGAKIAATGAATGAKAAVTGAAKGAKSDSTIPTDLLAFATKNVSPKTATVTAASTSEAATNDLPKKAKAT